MHNCATDLNSSLRSMKSHLQTNSMFHALDRPKYISVINNGNQQNKSK